MTTATQMKNLTQTLMFRMGLQMNVPAMCAWVWFRCLLYITLPKHPILGDQLSTCSFPADISLARRVFRDLAHAQNHDKVPHVSELVPFNPDEVPTLSYDVAACTNELVPYINKSLLQCSATMPLARAMLWNLQQGPPMVDSGKSTPHRQGCLPPELIATCPAAAQRVLHACELTISDRSRTGAPPCEDQLANKVHPLISCKQLTDLESLLLWAASTHPLWCLGPTAMRTATWPASQNTSSKAAFALPNPAIQGSKQQISASASLYSIFPFLCAKPSAANAVSPQEPSPQSTDSTCIDMSSRHVAMYDVPAIVAFAHSSYEERQAWASSSNRASKPDTSRRPQTAHFPIPTETKPPMQPLPAPTARDKSQPEAPDVATRSDPGCLTGAVVASKLKMRPATGRHPDAKADKGRASVQHSIRSKEVHITGLMLVSCGLTDSALALLALGLRDHAHLARLDLSKNPLITEKGIQALCTVAFASGLRKLRAGEYPALLLTTEHHPSLLFLYCPGIIALMAPGCVLNLQLHTEAC